MANPIATVAFIDGQAWAKAPDGSLRALVLGDVLNADEVLVTAEGARVELDFGDGPVVAIAGEQEVGMGPDLWEVTVTDPTEAMLADASIQQALTILEEGGDLFAELEAPAAGGGESSGGGGNSFVQVGRTGPDAFAEQQFDYGGVSRTVSSGTLDGQGTANGAPVTADLSFDLDEDTTLSGRITAQDPENDPLTYTLLTPPANGTLTLNPETGEFVYQPTENYFGPDSFTVTITDPRGNATTSTVTLNVVSVNDAPTTVDLGLQTNEDVPVTGQVVAEDIEGDTLTYQVSSLPANGTVVLDSATGEFVYTPNSNYYGSDTFVVIVSDGNGGTTTSTVTIDILPVNDAPVTSDISLVTNEDTPVAGRVVGTDVDDDSLTYTITTPATNGSVTLDPATGEFVYTPNPDYNGGDSFVVTVDDGNGGTTTSLVTIGVLPVNDAPVAANLNLATPEDTPVSGAIQASDADGDSLTYGLGNTPVNGSVTLNPTTGQFTYTPNANYNGSDSFTVTVSDGNGGTTISVVTIGVTPVNDAPVSANQNLTTPENTQLNGQINATDVDGDTLSYGLAGVPVNGSVNLNPVTGSFVYTPNTNYSGGDSFVVVISDGNGGTTTSIVTIGITPLNDAPVNDAPLADDLSLTTDEDVLVSGQIVATDVDGDTLTYTVTTDPTNGTVTSFDPASGEFEYTPGSDFYGSDSFVVTISDGKGGSTTSTVTIGVNPVNDAPVSDDLSLTTDEDVPVSGQIVATDVDGDTLTYAVTTSPANGTVTSFDPASGAFEYTPGTDFYGSDSFVVTISDGKGGTTTSTVTIGVNPVNDAPVANDLSLTTDEDVPVSGQIVATDVDGDTLTYAVTTGPTNGMVTSFDPASGEFEYTPGTDFHGSDSFVVTISDGNGGTTTSIVTIDITGTDDAPIISSGSGAVVEDITPSTSGTLTATDADNPSLAFVGSIQSGTYGNLVLQANGQWTYTLDSRADVLAEGEIQSELFTAALNDGSTTTVTISITGTDDLPVISIGSGAVVEDVTPSTSGTLTATDLDNPSLTFVGSTQSGTYGSLVLQANGQWTYTLDSRADVLAEGEIQSELFTVNLNDGSTTTVTISITGTDDLPVISTGSGAVVEDLIPSTFGTLTATDADNPSLAFGGSTQSGTYGSLVLQTNGQWTYTLDSRADVLAEGEIQSELFTVNLNDGSTTTVTISITGTDDLPVISTGSGSVVEDVTPSTSGTLTATDVDNPSLAFVGSTQSGTYGSLVLQTNGQWTYTLDSRADVLAEGEIQSELFTVTLTDGSSTTVTINITGTDDAPVISTGVGSVVEDISPSTSGTLTATDVDNPSLTFVGSTQSGTYGSLVLQTNGQWTYTLDSRADVLAEGEIQSEFFTVNLNDGSTTTVTIGITGTNDAPIANADSAATEIDVAVTFVVLNNDTDPDGDALTVTGASVDPAQGTVVVNANGTLTFTPALGYLGTATVTYTISDGNGGAASATASVLVHPVNIPPVAVNDPDGVPYSVNLGMAAGSASWGALDSKGQLVTITAFNANGTEGAFFRSGHQLGVAGSPRPPATANAEPNQLEYNPADGTSESIVVSLNGNLTSATFEVASLVASEDGGEVGYWTAYYQGTVVAGDSFRLTTGNTGTFAIDTGGKIFDSVSFSALHTFNKTGDGSGYFLTSFTGTGTEQANSNYLVMENGVLNVSVASGNHLLANDTDANGHSLVVTYINGIAVTDGQVLTLASGASLTINSDGSFSYAANGNFDYLRSGELGTDSFTYTVFDGFGGSSTATATVTIVGGSEAPVAVDDNLVVAPGVVSVIPASALLANDSDPDGDPLTIQSVQDVVNGTAIVSNGAVIFTPTDNDEGTASFKYTVRDPSGLTSTATANLIVASALAPSVVVAKSLVALAAGTGGVSVKFPITTSLVDTDGSETLSIRVSGVPTGVSFTAGTNLGDGIWSFVETDLPDLQLNLPGAYSNGSGTILTVEVTATEVNGNLTATTSSTLRLLADYTTTSRVIENGDFNALGSNDFIQGGSGNNALGGGNGNDLIYGGAGNDTINGGSGNDVLFGGDGDDVIYGGAGSDRISGGVGNDVMFGNSNNSLADNTVDVFVWSLGDQGAAGAPAVDTISLFGTAPATATSGGDVLDLRDLLIGESVGPGNSAGNLADYLHFEIADGNTIIHVSHTGGFGEDAQTVGAGYTNSAETQQIILTGVDLASVYSGATTDQEIITQLLNSNKLITD